MEYHTNTVRLKEMQWSTLLTLYRIKGDCSHRYRYQIIVSRWSVLTLYDGRVSSVVRSNCFNRSMAFEHNIVVATQCKTSWDWVEPIRVYPYSQGVGIRTILVWTTYSDDLAPIGLNQDANVGLFSIFKISTLRPSTSQNWYLLILSWCRWKAASLG